MIGSTPSPTVARRGMSPSGSRRSPSPTSSQENFEATSQAGMVSSSESLPKTSNVVNTKMQATASVLGTDSGANGQSNDSQTSGQSIVTTRASDVHPEASGLLRSFDYGQIRHLKHKGNVQDLSPSQHCSVVRAVQVSANTVDQKLSPVYIVKERPNKQQKNVPSEAQMLHSAGEFGISPEGVDNIVVMRDKGVDLQKLMAVRELDLAAAEYIDICHRLPQHQRQSIARQITQCLQKIHKAGIVHSDVKLENIAINSNGIASLIDFEGSVKSTKVKNGENIYKVHTHTSEYRAPERYESNLVSEKVDIWAFGVTLFVMETKELPRMSNQDKFCFNQYNKAIKTIQKSSKISPECKEVLFACFQLDPAKRPSAEELLKFSYFAERPLSEMSFMELSVAHNEAFQALVRAETAMAQGHNQVSTGAMNDFQLELSQCQGRVKEIQNLMKSYDERIKEAARKKGPKWRRKVWGWWKKR